MDERIKFKDQTDEKIEGPVILINKFNVQPDKVQEFLNDWTDDAIAFKRQQGFVSAQFA
jgi:heme-degrading monooxygenase HmoA